MKVLHINAGLEEGGGKNHIISLLSQFDAGTVDLLVLEDGIVAKEAKKLGITVHVFAQHSRYDLSILKRLAQFINAHSFDIIHTHGARANFIFSAIQNKVSAYWLITVHSDPALDFMNRGIRGNIFTKLNLASLKKADHIIVVTDSLKKPLLKLGIDEKKITVIYNGIDFRVEIAKTENLSKNEIFTLTCVARFHPIKGHELLLESLKSIDFSDYVLNLVGDGELKNSLEKKVHQLNLQKKVHFLGFLGQPEVEKVITTSDLTILASYNEGFPLVLLESAKQKVPFIATNVGDISLLIPNKSIGWLISPGSTSSLTQALNEAYREWQSGELNAKGNNVHHLASTQFSIEQFYQSTLSVYKKIIYHS